MVVWKPVGGAVIAMNLLQRKTPIPARNGSPRTLVGRRSSPGAVEGSGTRALGRIIDRHCGRRDVAVRPERHAGGAEERSQASNTDDRKRQHTDIFPHIASRF